MPEAIVEIGCLPGILYESSAQSSQQLFECQILLHNAGLIGGSHQLTKCSNSVTFDLDGSVASRVRRDFFVDVPSFGTTDFGFTLPISEFRILQPFVIISLIRRIDTQPGNMKHLITFDIQTYDTDFAGVVSNTTYVRWLDELRTGWLDTLMPRARQQAETLTLVVGRVEIDYLHPVGFFEADRKIIGEIQDIERGRTRIVFQASFRIGDKLVASAVQKTLLVNLANVRPARLPADVLRSLEELRPHTEEPSN